MKASLTMCLNDGSRIEIESEGNRYNLYLTMILALLDYYRMIQSGEYHDLRGNYKADDREVVINYGEW
jgi:hypothetical protein